MSLVRGFGSDNHAEVHPDIFNSMLQANQGHAHSYGFDENTEAVEKKIKDLFGISHSNNLASTSSYFVYNGTAANILALKACLESFNSVICSDIAHINVDECGGPEVYGGFKLIPVKSKNGKISLEDIKTQFVRKGDQHFSQVKVVSLTQPTELGTCYSLKEIKEICDWAHQNKLYVHIDGARFANACVYLKSSFSEMTTHLGVDVISFGGTKNGLLAGEIVIFINPQLGNNFKYFRKQFGQLPSKSRFIAAQFQAYFDNNLWHQIASHSLKMAKYLEEKLSSFSEIKIIYPVESNSVFVLFPKIHIKELKNSKFFYIWDELTFAARLMLSWDSKPSDVDEFIEKMISLGIK